MKLKTGIFALTAASVLVTAPTFAQEAADDQILRQEEAQQAGAALTVSPAVVRQIEQELNDLGYAAGGIDGVWDAQAQRGMMNWQQAQGIEPTGQINLRSIQLLGIETGVQQAGGGIGGGLGVGQQEEEAGLGGGLGEEEGGILQQEEAGLGE